MKFLQWIAFCVLVKTVTVAGDYVLEISLSSFSNPEERDAVGDCCFDNGTAPLQGVCPGSCNTTLWICVQDSDVPPNDFTCTIGMGIIPESLSSISIFSQGAWPGSFQLDILVINDQSETLGALVPNSPIPPGGLIDVVYVNDVSLAASLPQSPAMEFTGNFSQTTATLSFQVTCALNFFGVDCNSTCEGRDDALGHFTCDPLTGNRVCLPGYQNIAANCTDCLPLNGCSSIGGFCVDPGECVCRTGYFGDLCTENSSIIAPSATTTQLTASMTMESRLQTSTFIGSSPAGELIISPTSSVGQMTFTQSTINSLIQTSSVVLTTITLSSIDPLSSSSLSLSISPATSLQSQTLFSTRSAFPSSAASTYISGVDFTQVMATGSSSRVLLNTPQPTGLGVQPTDSAGVIPPGSGGVGVRASNTTIVWISVSVTVGASLLIAVSVLVFMAIAYSIKKERVLQNKKETGSQFFGLIHNANANNHSSEDAIPETLNNRIGIESRSNHTQTNNVELRDTIPDATYSTFQDSGHYSIKPLNTEEESDVDASVFSNSVAIQTEAPPFENKDLQERFVPIFSSDNEKTEERVEPDLQLLTEESSFCFREDDFKQNLGGDLLSSIEDSLSHSTQANNYFPGMIAAFSHSTDITTEDKLTTESDFAPSFIYADHTEGGPNAVNENEFRLSSVSPD